MTRERAASQTALLIAAYRGRASTRPEPLCSDPWATALAGPDGAEIAARLDPTMPHMELWVAVRTAYLDAHVRYWTSPGSGIEQVVLLGAGLDTRAARLARPGLSFFEVDHPASQRDKRRRLEGLSDFPVQAARYVACDFEKDDFVERLGQGGCDLRRPAVFVWEGVTPYLGEPAIRATLRRVATGCHPGSILLFDHFNRRMSEGQKRPEKDEQTRAFVEGLGERIVFGSNDMLPILYEEGFRHVRSVSFDEACLTLTGTYAREREFRFQRIVLCSVTPTPLP